MKKIDGTILRSIFALVLGLVLVLWPGSAVQYLVIVIGVLFIIPGVISLASYLRARSKSPDFSSSFTI